MCWEHGDFTLEIIKPYYFKRKILMLLTYPLLSKTTLGVFRVDLLLNITILRILYRIYAWADIGKYTMYIVLMTTDFGVPRRIDLSLGLKWYTVIIPLVVRGEKKIYITIDKRILSKIHYLLYVFNLTNI